jgi:hypothetical protein
MNTITQAERDNHIAKARSLMEKGLTPPEAIAVFVQSGISFQRARAYVSKAVRIRRREEIRRNK